MATQDALGLFDAKSFGAWRVAIYAKLTETGSIGLCSGTFSQRPRSGVAAYAAVNAALEGFTRALAVELAPRRVNCVCPGIVNTDIHLQYLDKLGKNAMLEQAADALPLERVAEPQDVAQAFVSLMGNPHITGQVLVVDGGGVLV
jgi:NAD(P)-dependent dehydrogenase (short-subunit alcohol dehydrogenase family)